MPKFISLGERTGADQGMADYLRAYGFDEVDSPWSADIIVFNGGADIATELYGQSHYISGRQTKVSARDAEEMAIWKAFAPNGRSKGQKKLMLGICRGAQLCNVLAGGSLIQDVNNHGVDHTIRFSIGCEWADEPPVKATSTHHQMMQVGQHGHLLAYATESTQWNGGHKTSPTAVDPEIVWYPTRNALCIQGHPEYVPNSDFSRLCIKLITHYLNQVQPSAA